ncbi:hypothetical protein EB118_15040 [bacterium]|nr:hypothetical protein [bacterium]
MHRVRILRPALLAQQLDVPLVHPVELTVEHHPRVGSLEAHLDGRRITEVDARARLAEGHHLHQALPVAPGLGHLEEEVTVPWHADVDQVTGIRLAILALHWECLLGVSVHGPFIPHVGATCT